MLFLHRYLFPTTDLRRWPMTNACIQVPSQFIGYGDVEMMKAEMIPSQCSIIGNKMRCIYL